MQYYTAFVLLVWLALALLCVLVYENNRTSKKDKSILFFTCAMVAFAATAEWVGILLKDKPDAPLWLYRLVKFFDYIFTPAVGGIFILQLKKTSKVFTYAIEGVLVVNIIFQFISLFTNWMVKDDKSHGSLYTLYIVLYFIILVLVIVGFAFYGRNFKRQNRGSLFSILAFVVVGILLQVIFNIRIAYVAISFGLIALFIHTSEFLQLVADEKIEEQTILITIDPLTGILNRYAYEKDISKLDLSNDFVVFSIDINGLKNANDTHGHQAGDELICGAADVITKVLGKYGHCYRTGGDEFIVLAFMPKEKVEKVIDDLEKKAEAWEGTKIESLSLSIGEASRQEFEKYSIDDLVGVADKRMYANKADYYMTHGRDRRKN